MSYALLTTIGLSPKNTLLVMLIIPFAMALTFWRLIVRENDNIDSVDDSTNPLLNTAHENQNISSPIDNFDDENISVQQNSSQTDGDLKFREMVYYTKVIIT